MELPITFQPLASPLFGAVSLSILAALISAAGIYFFTKNRSIDRLYRQLFSMLCFFAFMMSFGSAVLGWFFGERLGPVVVHENKFETAYGELEYDLIKNIILKKELENNSIITPQLSGNYKNKIILTTKTGEQFIFSESNYPVKEMIAPMRRTWEKGIKKGPAN